MNRWKLSSSPPVFLHSLMLKNIRDVASMGFNFTVDSPVINFATSHLFLYQENSVIITILEVTMGYYFHNKSSYCSVY
ncbi:hypothetical protein AYI69_g2984 [Smittium culicis]|uniref:Uncharacterized protein n=1 Tax=Smittium culicis TaxID=133412 RepID=A0A1R1YL98_9FUNG|nr:hypothetical protein AYI69_g2984 [Smittium culicis]